MLIPRLLFPATLFLTMAAWTTGPAGAQSLDEAASRQRRQVWESPQNFALELRFGPYRPDVDAPFPDTKPFETTFGDSSRLLFGLEIDWQMLRIPHLGTLGPGLGWSYTKMSAKGKVVATGADADEDTSLLVMPMYAVGVLRLDVLARETDIPVVGYAKAGLGLGFYSMSNSVETQARGHTWGMHYAAGAMLLLDSFDDHAANSLDQELGVNNTYYYFEWMWPRLSEFGKGDDKSVFNLSASTWTMGLAFEF